jgi:hypothetical protein
VLVDLERQALGELLPERTAESTTAWLAQHPEVGAVSRERAGLYAEVWIAHESCRSGNFHVPHQGSRGA